MSIYLCQVLSSLLGICFCILFSQFFVFYDKFYIGTGRTCLTKISVHVLAHTQIFNVVPIFFTDTQYFTHPKDANVKL